MARSHPNEYARHARPDGLPDVELLDARYVRHAFAPHAHEGYAFGVITRGLERFQYRGADHVAGPGAVIALDPEVVHTGGPGDDDGWTYRMIYVGHDAFERMVTGPKYVMPSFPEPVIADPALASALAGLGASLLDACGTLERESVLAHVLATLARRHARPSRTVCRTGKTPGALRIVRERVQAVADGALNDASLVDLAATAGLSPTQLLRSYARAYGLPPHAHVRELRLRHARLLLRDGAPPADVAARTGFADQSHLTRWFKRRMGVTPAAYARGAF